MTPKKVAVVVKRSAYRLYVEEGKSARVKHLLQVRDPTVGRLVSAHRDHTETVEEVLASLKKRGVRAHVLEGSRRALPRDCDLVVTVGGDGTLLTTSHQLGPDVPILGVNSSPDNSVGFFCAARKGRVDRALDAALSGKMKRVVLSRMQVTVNDVVVNARVLNEALICHECPAATSRYLLRVADRGGAGHTEEQKSSGIWIGPAAGSTAAQRSAGGRVLPLTSRRIQFVVREPYTPLGDKLGFVRGIIGPKGFIELRSKMRDGRIYLDGPHEPFEITLGDRILLSKSKEPLTVLGVHR